MTIFPGAFAEAAATASAGSLQRQQFHLLLLQNTEFSVAATAVALRGGSTESPLSGLDNFDIGRAKIRLDELTSFGVVTALLMNAGLRLYSSTPTNIECGRSHHLDNAVKIVFCASVVVSVMAGSYTTIVFSLLGLYSKTALGLGLDGPFLDFMDRTATIRL